MLNFSTGFAISTAYCIEGNQDIEATPYLHFQEQICYSSIPAYLSAVSGDKRP